ncbi:MAG: NAD(P)H-binding protein [Micromonosporaceae bacterium]|nr:NAD(P)H-binding protein [Micromonosporaceae bacterium]
MADELIAVTGAGGGVGGRLARRLAAAGAGVTQRLLTRDPGRAPSLHNATATRADFRNPRSVEQALTGVQSLFLVSATEDADRVQLHTNAVDAARAAGVARIVYLSFLAAAPDATFTFARDHWHTEQYIQAAGIAYTFLRDSLYQDVLPFFADSAGVIRGPAGDGRFAPVTRDDVADVAAAVLRGAGEHDGARYDVTGPAAITMAEVSAELTRASGRPVRYHAETLPEAYASRARFGAPEWAVAGWVTSYAAIATGELDVVSGTVAELAGHPPISFAEFLAANPGPLARLRREREQEDSR